MTLTKQATLPTPSVKALTLFPAYQAVSRQGKRVDSRDASAPEALAQMFTYFEA